MKSLQKPIEHSRMLLQRVMAFLRIVVALYLFV
jgi:hypothetical protein